MATKKSVDLEADAVSESVEVTTEQAFSIDALQKHCRELFGVPTVVFAGATAGIDAEKKYTVSEMKEIITKWCSKEVK